MNLSFALTNEEYVRGDKTVTRRPGWKISYFKTWCRAWELGRLVHQGYSKSPRAGGKRTGEFRLIYRPYLEALKDMPLSDLEAEGGRWHSVKEYCDAVGYEPHVISPVIRFIRLGSVKYYHGGLVGNDRTKYLLLLFWGYKRYTIYVPQRRFQAHWLTPSGQVATGTERAWNHFLSVARQWPKTEGFHSFVMWLIQAELGKLTWDGQTVDTYLPIIDEGC